MPDHIDGKANVYGNPHNFDIRIESIMRQLEEYFDDVVILGTVAGTRGRTAAGISTGNPYAILGLCDCVEQILGYHGEK